MNNVKKIENNRISDETIKDMQEEITKIKQKLSKLEENKKGLSDIKTAKLKEYKMITFKIDKELGEQLNKFSKQEGYTVQSLINKAIEDLLERYFDEEIDL